MLKFKYLFLLFILCAIVGFAETSYEILQIEHTEAAEIARIVAPQFSNLTITVSENKNALVVSGPSSDIARLKTILPLLDVAPRQVKITAKLSEISETAVKELGVKWPGVISTTLVEKEGVNTAFRGFSRSNIVIPATINLLEQNGEMSTVETATISVLTGNKGVIRFQNLIPVTVLRERTHYGNIIESFAILPVGLELIVYPRVFPDGKIQLKLMSGAGQISGQAQPGITIADIKGALTEIIARSGETVVIGSVDKSQMRVVSSPGNTRKQINEAHLIILVTPELQ